MENMSPEAMAAWDRLRQTVGYDLQVNSAYRSPEHNAKVGGAKHSQHTHGNAFDIDVSGLPLDERANLIKKARQSGFRGIGVYDNALHFDVGPTRNWGPSYGRESTPEWAMEALGVQPMQYGDTVPREAQTGPQGWPMGQPVPNKLDRFTRAQAIMSMMPQQRNLLNVEDFLT